ncbi:glucosylglycerolphosphate phosphatase, partial [Prochlorococcus sp. AH-736-A20]|nr:glucosylglycerolphosphate phosphatase [Prochlorococcus sp. AH-736-A20]
MEYSGNNLNFQKQILFSKKILFIQDIDGVCIPLVKDPLARELDSKFIYAAKSLAEEFFVLTCGEHEGHRGVNRIVERSLKSTIKPKDNELYLRGLAACGVEYQDSDGETSFEGITEKELDFLSKVPSLMKPKFDLIVKNIFPELDQEDINLHADKSICDTRFSPTINFNSLFDLVNKDSEKRRLIQISFEKMMNEIICKAESEGIKNSFFLHISPNLGSKNGKEI